jgi:hypothetical protein
VVLMRPIAPKASVPSLLLRYRCLSSLGIFTPGGPVSVLGDD